MLGREFLCIKGVRQGDCLSPLLFVIAADLLQSVVNDMFKKGILKLPIPCHDQDYPIVQYADDTLIILPADRAQLLALKDMLHVFSTSTGLVVNYHKSSMVPINVDENTTISLAAAFGCQVGKMPFTYLGLPVGTTRPRMVDFMPLVDCMDRRMTTSSSFLNQGERLQFLNSALSSMPIFYLGSLLAPAGILKQLERIQRQCLWRKHRDEPSPSLAAWDLICRPKNKGGLGILNLGVKNMALLLKHLHRFLNRVDLPWVSLIWDTYYHSSVPQGTDICGSFWWKDICKLLDHYRNTTWVQINSGHSTLFWSDKWKIGDSVAPLQSRFPRLFSYVKDPWITVFEAFQSQDMINMFHLPLSAQAYQEFLTVQDLMVSCSREVEQKDTWFWQGTCNAFKPKLFYSFMHSNMSFNPLLLWIWKSSYTMKIKVFAWMLIMDRLNTKDMVERRHWHLDDGVNCLLCPLRTRETRNHLFFECNFSVRIWNYLQITWSPGDDMSAIVMQAKQDFAQPFFTEVVFVACWNIWIIRNARVFRHERQSFNKWRSAFIHDITLMQHRVKARYKEDLLKWISFLPP